MAERLTVPHDEGKRNAGTWFRFNHETWFICPKCWFKASLADHGIDADGSVEPSVVCPNRSCDFHEHLTLEVWSHEA